MKNHFIIPTNFMETGYVLNGTVSIRNAIEAGVMALLGILICRVLPLPDGTKAITWYILICGPLGLIGLSGVQGDPLSVFILDFIKWRKRRKPFFYSGHNEAYTQEAADSIMETPQVRDMIAGAVDKLRSRMSSGEVDYVEGKTFEFEVDPEQEALKQAQKELDAKKEEEAARRQEEQKKREAELAAQNNPFRKPDTATSVNAKQVSEMLVLDNLDWEEEN